MSSRVQRRFWIAALAVIAAACGLMFARLMQQANGPPRPAIGGAFTLVDTAGKPFTERDLAGKPYAMFFGYTRCPDVCPTSLALLSQLRVKLGAKADRLNIVFVSVDPGIDTPESIGNYLALFHMPVIGLTGTEAQVDAIASAYKVVYAKVPDSAGGYSIDHTAAIYLMDAKGAFVDLLRLDDTPAEAETKLLKLIEGS